MIRNSVHEAANCLADQAHLTQQLQIVCHVVGYIDPALIIQESVRIELVEM